VSITEKEKNEMRRLLIALPLAVLFTMITPSLHAAVYTLDPVTDPLGDCSGAVTADQCMSSGTTTTTCSDSWGCPQCGMNSTTTDSLCFRLFGNYGFCSCTPAGTFYDKYGNIQARCYTKGACNTR
jgi:hypothetical protein